MIKILDNEEFLILCQKHIVFSKLGKEISAIKEIEIADDSSILYYGDSYWFRQYIDKEYAYFFKFDFVKYFALINSVNFRKWIFSIDFL